MCTDNIEVRPNWSDKLFF